ncbi:MAG: outer membrane lipoprotein carrier protein LolA [Thermodesulfobacteriota bacterium]
MILAAALLLALASQNGDIISTAIERYGAVDSYQVTLRSRSSDTYEVIRYYYKRPGFVRMEFVTPHKGAVLVYDPLKKVVALRPFGFFRPFVLRLDPDNRLVKSSKGHRVDQSDIGFLLGLARELQADGATEMVGEEAVNGREALHVRVTGKDDTVVRGEINGYSIWLDRELMFPIKVISYDSDGEVIEEVLMDDLEVNPKLSEDSFLFK